MPVSLEDHLARLALRMATARVFDRAVSLRTATELPAGVAFAAVRARARELVPVNPRVALALAAFEEACAAYEGIRERLLRTGFDLEAGS